MGHYIKITGRGYLKNVDLTYSVDYQNKFSKQLTLAHCADSKEDAIAYKNKVVAKIKEEADLIETVYNTALKIITFPEMFNTKKDVLTFISKNVSSDIDKKIGYGYSGYYKSLTYYFDNNCWKPSKTVEEAIGKFKKAYDGYERIEGAYKSINTASKLIEKASIVQLDNYNVTVTNGKIKKAQWYTSMACGNDNTEKYPDKIHCTCCGAAIPGGKYLGRIGATICPYCIVKFAEEAQRNIEKLGPDMAKAYQKALFVKNL